MGKGLRVGKGVEVKGGGSGRLRVEKGVGVEGGEKGEIKGGKRGRG